jgi:hypothetical protein
MSAEPEIGGYNVTRDWPKLGPSLLIATALRAHSSALTDARYLASTTSDRSSCSSFGLPFVCA